MKAITFIKDIIVVVGGIFLGRAVLTGEMWMMAIALVLFFIHNKLDWIEGGK